MFILGRALAAAVVLALPAVAPLAQDRGPAIPSDAPTPGSAELALGPIAPPPLAPSHPAEVETAPAWWSAGLQSTYVLQRTAGFASPYTGTNSLVTAPETGYTLTATAFLGVRPWSGAEVFFNPEATQSQDISHLSGLGGLANGENQKGGGPVPILYRARAFLRQTFSLGGEASVTEAATNQLGGTTTARRIVVTAGNFSWGDVFDGVSVAHDPRTQFLNWSLMSYGAADYAADVRGYTWGLAVEGYLDDWAFRAGRFAQPRESNGLALDPDLLEQYGDTIEIEHGHSIGGRAGRVRLTGFHNHARMGSFADALRDAAAAGGVPDVGRVRREQSKWGFGIGAEQEVTRDATAFGRYSFNDGRTETYAFAEIERSLTLGLSVQGRSWRRPGDTLGVAWAMNGLSDDHQAYLRAGGVGFLIGDGRLSYRPEQIVEAYYSFRAFRGLWLSADVQRVWNPAYNADRGPVNILGVRVHLQT